MCQHLLPELNAMQQIASIICDLTPAEQRRVAVWLMEYASQEDNSTEESDTPKERESKAATTLAAEATNPIDKPEQREFATFLELYNAVAPKKGAQKAAVAGYWLEVDQGQQSWKAYEVNKLLKSIDVKISSMSIVLTNAVKAKDALIVELDRLGNSERSRKTFRLSDKGIAYVTSSLG